ncbi:MAG TPA: formate/nitrite transporter family protein [Gemmatimonadales bacterium]|jgi:formate/nitrite transporter FocA (FNT family)
MPKAAKPVADVAAHDRPLDEPQKNYHTVLQQQIVQAEEELRRPAPALLLSGLTAGLDIGFGPFAMAVVLTLTRGAISPALQQLLLPNFYAVGFLFVVLGRSALFTEHTASAIQPVLDGRASIVSLLRLWGLVLAANIVGATIMTWFSVRMGLALHIVDADAFRALADRMTAPSSGIIFCSAIGAGWLMGLLSWLTVAARDTTAQFLIVWMTTFIIGLAGLHHSIAGTVEVLGGFFAHTGTTLPDYLHFLILAVLGNAVGGTVFVAALKYSHIKAVS